MRGVSEAPGTEARRAETARAKRGGVGGSACEGPVVALGGEAQHGCYNWEMSKPLENAVAVVRKLPEAEQDRAAQILFAFLHDPYEEERELGQA